MKKSNKSAVWFGRAIWLGILADWIPGVPGIFAPNETLGFFVLPLSPNPT